MQQQRKTYVDKNGEVRRYPERKNQSPPQRQAQRPQQKQAQRPQQKQAQRPVQKQAQRPVQKQAQRPVQKQAQRPAAQSTPRDWVYPEGYKPPQRRPQRASQPKKRPPQKKPKQDYRFLWVFLGQLAVRLGCGILAGCAIVGILYYNKFYGVPEDDRQEITYIFSETVDEKEVKTTFEASASAAYRDGNLMVSFSDIAAWLDMAQVGDIYTMRFVVRGSEDTGVVFHYSSHNAFIGDEIIVMEGRTRFDNGEVWVPLSFVQTCMKGFDVTVEDDTVKLSRNGDAIGFSVKASEPIAPCEYPE